MGRVAKQAYEQPVGDSWRMDETYLNVRGQLGLPLPGRRQTRQNG